MRATLRAKLISYLSEEAGWHRPESIIKKLPEPTRRAINKALQGLLKRGVVNREYIKPKKYDTVKWKGLADIQKSEISRNSRWRIKPDKRGIVQTFSILWQEGGQQAIKDFLNSPYCKKNEDLIFYLSNKTFFQEKKRPTVNYPHVDMKETIKGLTNAEKEIVKKGLNSPTFMDLILNGKSSNELSEWFMDTSSENLGEYIKFVLFACLVVDCFSQKGDSTAEIIETLAVLYDIKKHVTPLGLFEIAKLSKPVKAPKEQLMLPYRHSVHHKAQMQTKPKKGKVHKQKKVIKARRGSRRAK